MIHHIDLELASNQHGAPSGTFDRQARARLLISEARRQDRAALDEMDAKRIVSMYGMSVPRSVRVKDTAHLDTRLLDLSAPWVLKLISQDVLHKSDVGGVRVGLTDKAAVLCAMTEMDERCRREGFRLDGFLIEEMAPSGHEIVIGGTRDPSFGQIIMFGLGGVFLEVIRDVSFRICPITPIDAQDMIGELRAADVLAGARGGIKVPEAILVRALMAIGGERGLFAELGTELAEIDLNPIVVSANGAVAVDARFVLSKDRMGC